MAIYNTARAHVRTNCDVTDDLDMTIGLLQGEVLSPLIFSLYTSDIEGFLQDANIGGVRLIWDVVIHLLMFADDTALLSSTQAGLQRKVRCLEKYFDSLRLEVNLDKTKVMVFRRGGAVPRDCKFYYKGRRIEIVSEYTYLGVPFTSFGAFERASRHFKDKGLVALASVWNVITRGHMDGWEGKLQLFNSLIKSTSMYACHIWGLRYIATLEQVQNRFLKRVFGLIVSTPGYLLRLETGLESIGITVLRKALNYWGRLNNMGDERYAKVCLEEMKQGIDSGESRYNWLAQVRDRLDMESFNGILHCEQKAFVSACNSALIEASISSREKDIRQVVESDKNAEYSLVMPECGQPAGYLDMGSRKVKLLMQLRISNKFIRWDGFLHEFDDDTCKICRSEENTLKHCLFTCTQLGTLNGGNDDSNYFNAKEKEEFDRLFLLASHKLGQRRVILEMLECLSSEEV